MIASAGQWKQDILRIYNEINKKLFNAGVRQQKVDFVGNKIIILSINSRVPVLKVLDTHAAAASREINLVLHEVFKSEIKQAFMDEFQVNIRAVLKDYDVETEYSGTIIILEKDLEHYLNVTLEL
ncbi:Na-translocating system protein MpsC family protein [Paenibacillus tengchongensis]|uniref:Na-translocating system protein MpsC family protein n=1 Tax=Paenibacillus tengchongensis TaxID=2608684 RepID=UPI00165289A3|nr:Na-translocating system protein MpsC family protein [Paenibacillus tengchongensis]